MPPHDEHRGLPIEKIRSAATSAIMGMRSCSDKSFKSLLEAAGIPLRLVRGGSWRGLNFDKQNIGGIDFRDTDLRGCTFVGAKIVGCDFVGALVDWASLRLAEDWIEFEQGLLDGPQSHFSKVEALTFQGHSSKVIGLSKVGRRKLASWSDDGELRFWHANGSCFKQVSEHKASNISGSTWFAGGVSMLTTWCDRGKVFVWGGSGVALDKFEAGPAEIVGVASSTQRFLFWDSKGTLSTRPHRGTHSMPINLPFGSVSGAARTTSGRILCWNSNQIVITNSSGKIYSRYIFRQPATLIALLNDTTLVAVEGADTVVYLACRGRLDEIHRRHFQAGISIIQTAPRGGYLVSSFENYVTVCSGATSNLRRGAVHDTVVMGGLDLHNRTIVTWGNDQKLLGIDSEGSNIKFVGHDAPIAGALEMLPHKICSWDTSGEVRFWSRDGLCVGAIQTPFRSGITDAIVLDDHRVAVWGNSNEFLVLNMNQPP